MSRICTDLDPPDSAAAAAGKSAPPDIWKGLPPPRRWNDVEADLNSGVLRPPEVILEGLLYRGGKALLAAPSKARKTWMMLHLCACVAGGQNWLGFNTTRTPVLFLDLELLPHEMPQRMVAITEAARLWNLDNLHTMQLRGNRLSMARLKAGLKNYLTENGIGLLFIDPWYKLSGGADEIGTEGVAELLAELEEIASECNCAIVISHHFTKGDSSQKSVIDLASGSGVFGRDPDLICGIRELKDSTLQTPMIKMEFVVRSFKPVDPITLRWDFPLWVRDDSLNQELKSPASGGRPVSAGVADVVEILGDKELTGTEWSDLCCQMLDISSRTFRGLKAQAVAEGLIESKPHGRTVLCKRTNTSNL